MRLITQKDGNHENDIELYILVAWSSTEIERRRDRVSAWLREQAVMHEADR
jgi:hypothetical protein